MVHAEGVVDRNLDEAPYVLDGAKAVEVVGACHRTLASTAESARAPGLSGGLSIGRVMDPTELPVGHGWDATRLAVGAGRYTLAAADLSVLADHSIRACGLPLLIAGASSPFRVFEANKKTPRPIRARRLHSGGL